MSKTTPKILIVDDVEFNVLVLESMLVDDFCCISALSGELALKIADLEMPNIILLDILMPKMDGYEVLRRLGRDDKLKKIPVIMVSAKSSEEDIRLAFELNAFDYIKKPVEYDELISKIQKALLSSESDYEN